MPWLDQVLAVPIIGVLFEPSLLTPMRAWPAFEKICQGWGEIKVGGGEGDQGKYHLEREDGLGLDVDMANVVCKFAYKLRMENDGPFPSLQTPDLRPYSELLAMVSEKLQELISELGMPRAVQRVGVMVDCNLSRAELPPGITGFAERVARAVAGRRRLDAHSGRYTIILDERKSHGDRCHYTFDAKSAGPEARVRFKMDWQRLFANGPRQATSSVNSSISACVAAASEHFEAFGAGAELAQ